MDIGNSRIKWALDEAGGIRGLSAMEYKPDDLPALLMEHWKNLPHPERIFVSNVAGKQVADVLVKVCSDTWSSAPCFIQVEKETCGVINGYDDIDQLGVDRWLSIIAAWSGGHNDVCVVGCGTALTIDLILADGRHLGGYIIPGTHMMLETTTLVRPMMHLRQHLAAQRTCKHTLALTNLVRPTQPAHEIPKRNLVADPPQQLRRKAFPHRSVLPQGNWNS